MFFRRKTSPEKRPLSEEKSSKGKPRAASGGRGGVGDPWGRIQAGERRNPQPRVGSNSIQVVFDPLVSGLFDP